MNALVPMLAETMATGLQSAITGGGFDVDMLHAMEQRDETLIREEVLNGSLSKAFVYNFKIQGKDVAGVSVIGARHLAHHYGGMKHRIVASTEKRGPLFKFTQYPSEGVSMQVTAAVLHDLAQDPDYYTVVVELIDIKKGNTLQVERTETRFEKRQDGSLFERPNFMTIAQSKAYRNGVLGLVPQDVRIAFQERCIQLGNSVTLTDDAMQTKRNNCLRFATAKGIPLERSKVEALTWDQLCGLGEAAGLGAEAFAETLRNLGMLAAGSPQIEAGAGNSAVAGQSGKAEPAKTRTRKAPEPKVESGGEAPKGEPKPMQTADGTPVDADGVVKDEAPDAGPPVDGQDDAFEGFTG